MSIDRRQFKRFETLLIVEVGPQKEDASYFFGITKNVSFEGFIFESQNYDLQTGDILEFRLKHPKNNLSVPVLGEIIWNSETKFECYSGVKFHRFDSETRSKVFELISADSIEHAAHVPMREGPPSAPKRNGKAESESKKRDDMLSDIIGHAATHNTSNQTGHDDTGNGAPLPVGDRKHSDKRSVETAGEEVTADAVKIDNRKPDIQKEEEKSKQNNVSKTANGFPVRRKGHKKRRSYALLMTVFFVLFIAGALVLFISDDLREKIMPTILISRYIENSDAVNYDSGMPGLNETDASEPPPFPGDQSEALPDHDKETADGSAVTGTGTPFDENGQRDLSDHDHDGTAEPFAALPITKEIAVTQDMKDLPQEKEVEPVQPVASQQDVDDMPKEEGSPGNIGIKDFGDKNIMNAEIAASEKKKEALQKIRETLQKESKPVRQAVKENSAEKPAPSGDKTGLEQAPAQEMTTKGADKKNDTSIKISEPEKDESVRQDRIAVQKPDKAPTDTTKNAETVFTQDKETGKDVPPATDLTASKDEVSGRVSDSVKKSKTGEVNDPGILNASAPVRQTPAETLIAKTDAPQPGIAESVLMNEKPERKEPLTRREPKLRDIEDISKKDGSKGPADRDITPRIALVLQNDQSNISDAKNEPEITDEYLKKHFTAYRDDFNGNSNNWDIFDIGAASARIEDGLYHIENKNQGGALIVLHYQRFPHESDFVLEIAIRAVRGTDKNAYGFIFGAKDARNNYSFQITENKYYAVKNYQHGVSGQLTSGAIKASLENSNSPVLLKIVKQADDIHFYINNWHADKVSNLGFFGSQIGFIVEGKSHIAIDYTRSYIGKADKEGTN